MQSECVSAYGHDSLGSITAAVSQGILEEQYRYDAFGGNYEGELKTDERGYKGKPHDPVTGLYNYGYRDYDPVTGRFSTVDPIRDGRNWYVYTANDPVNYIDAWGLLTEDGGNVGVSVAPQPQIATADPSCDIRGWNEALDAGMDPRGQNGETWNGNELTVREIYGYYPNNRNEGVPPEGTNGFAFYDSTANNQADPTHLEYYDNTDEDTDTYTRYQTDGSTEVIQQQRDIDNPVNDNWTYIPLNLLP